MRETCKESTYNASKVGAKSRTSAEFAIDSVFNARGRPVLNSSLSSHTIHSSQ